MNLWRPTVGSRNTTAALLRNTTRTVWRREQRKHQLRCLKEREWRPLDGHLREHWKIKGQAELDKRRLHQAVALLQQLSAWRFPTNENPEKCVACMNVMTSERAQIETTSEILSSAITLVLNPRAEDEHAANLASGLLLRKDDVQIPALPCAKPEDDKQPSVSITKSCDISTSSSGTIGAC
jgi:hypothetical protein